MRCCMEERFLFPRPQEIVAREINSAVSFERKYYVQLSIEREDFPAGGCFPSGSADTSHSGKARFFPRV